MFKSRLNELLGGENLDGEITIVVSPEEHIEQQQDQAIAEAETDIAEAQEAIAQNENDIETLEERVEDLEEAIDGLEALTTGARPWNPELAQDLYNRARKIDVRTFGDEQAVSVKGSECFSDKDSAQIELLAGMESLKEKAGKMWDGIKAFFVNLYKGVIAFFVGLFNRFKGLEKKADAIVSRLNGMADDKIKKEIKLGGWNAFVNIDLRKSKGGNLLKDLSTDVLGAVDAIGAGLAAGKDGEANLATARAALSTFTGAADEKKSKGSNENTESFEAKVGAVTVNVTMPKAGAKDAVAAAKETKVTYSVGKEGAKTDGTLATGIGKAGLIKLAQDAKEGAKKGQMAKFDTRALELARDKAVAVAESKAKGGDNAKEEKKEVQLIMQSHNAALRVSRVITDFYGDCIKAQLALVSAHI